ncbi:MAG: hypothetical protein ABI047_14700 [Jatrophihabitantaceae bacterium]
MTTTPPETAVPWAPEDLPVQAQDLAAFSYVVVEEVVGPLALLRRWSWPDVDQRGRLIWLADKESDSDAAAVAVELLRAQLYAPNGLSRRPRCGDTFAASRWADSGGQDEPEVSDLRELLTSPLYDISADAREAAKLAYHASLGAVPPAESVDEQARTEQARALGSRTVRPLRALKIKAPPRMTR